MWASIQTLKEHGSMSHDPIGNYNFNSNKI